MRKEIGKERRERGEDEVVKVKGGREEGKWRVRGGNGE